MILKSIHVNGLFHNINYCIDLSDEGLTFLHSMNGVGKSTILKMVRDIFAGDIESLTEIYFDSIDLIFDTCKLTVENGQGLRYILTKDGKEEEIDQETVRSSYTVYYMSPERLAVRMEDGVLRRSMDVIWERFNALIKLYSEDRELKEVPEEKLKRPDDGEYIFWCKDLKARLDFINEYGVSPNMPDLTFPPSRFEYNDNREEYIRLANSIEEWTDRHYRFAESVSVFLDIINGMMRFKQIVISGSEANIVLKNGETLHVRRLSSGEKQIVVIFYSLLFETENGSLMIIDEPEISLHIAWQQKMGQIFLDICKMKDIQMIVATHSPQLIHDRWDLATELRLNRA